MIKNVFLFGIILSLSLNSYSNETKYFYTVQFNDVVSTILYKADLSPIYGDLGLLEVLKKENSQNIPNLDSVLKGQKLFFPKALAERALEKGHLILKNQNELVFALKSDRPELAQQQQRRNVANENSGENSAPPTTAKAIEKDSEKSPVPFTEAKPAEPAIKTQPSLDEAQSRFVFSLGSGYSRLDSTIQSNGANAVLLSQPLFTGEIRWEHIWSGRLESFINFNFISIPYLEANRGQVYDGHPSLTAFSVGAVRNFENSFRALFEIGVSQELQLTSYQMGTATVEVKPLSFVKSVFSKDLLQVRKLKLSAGLGFSYLLGSSMGSTQIDPAMKYLGQLQVAQKFKNFSFFSLGEYSELNQKMSLTEQKRREVRGSFGFIIPLGGESP